MVFAEPKPGAKPWVAERIAQWKEQFGPGPYTVRLTAAWSGSDGPMVYLTEFWDVGTSAFEKPTKKSPARNDAGKRDPKGRLVRVKTYGGCGMVASWFKPV